MKLVSRSITVLSHACLLVLLGLASPSLLNAAEPYDPDWEAALAKAKALEERMAEEAELDSIMSEAIALGTLTECTGQKAGIQATQSLNTQVRSAQKEVYALCDQNQPDRAIAKAISSLESVRNHPATPIAIACYRANQPMYDQNFSPEITDAIRRYLRWLNNPSLARTEMQRKDVCG